MIGFISLANFKKRSKSLIGDLEKWRRPMKSLVQCVIEGAFGLALCTSIAGDSALPQAAMHPVYPGMDHQASSHQAESDSSDGVIDACSLICLSCHDGINASEARTKTEMAWELFFDYQTRSHPIGIDYEKASLRSSELRSQIFLPREIILPGGKVGCESCHNLYSTLPNFLIYSKADSALCLNCHIK
jgi:predicted CXXCH cytochrome family protein